MIHTSRQLKALVHNLSEKIGIPAQILLRKYMMERFLERVSLSFYKDSFILKGGMLVSALVGIDARATMDIDTTVKGMPLTTKNMEQIINEIISIAVDDGVTFKIRNVSEIMEDADYGGVRAGLDAHLDGAIIPLKIDVTAGDAITPREIRYDYGLMFEERRIPVMAYPIETVLAEKIETMIARAETNSRMRDFYDMHILLQTQAGEIDPKTLSEALDATAEKRGTRPLMNDAEAVLSALESNAEMRRLWGNYQRKYSYAVDYSWEDVTRSARRLCLEAGLAVHRPSVLARLNMPLSSKAESREIKTKHHQQER